MAESGAKGLRVREQHRQFTDLVHSTVLQTRMGDEASELIGCYQDRVRGLMARGADHVGEHDGGESALGALGIHANSPAPGRLGGLSLLPRER